MDDQEPSLYQPNPFLPGDIYTQAFTRWVEENRRNEIFLPRISIYGTEYIIPLTSKGIIEVLRSPELVYAVEHDPRFQIAEALGFHTYLGFQHASPFMHEGKVHRQLRDHYTSPILNPAQFAPIIESEVRREVYHLQEQYTPTASVNVANSIWKICMRIGCAVLGIDPDLLDLERLHALAAQTAEFTSAFTPDQMRTVDEVATEFLNLMRPHLQGSRIGHCRAALENDGFHFEAYAAFFFMLIYFDPKDLALSAVVRMSALNEQEREDIRIHPDLLSNVIYETSRIDPAVGFEYRIAEQATTIGNEHVEAGTGVLALPIVAGRDPDRYDHPLAFTYNRDPKTIDLITFGQFGRHFCPGRFYTLDVLLPTLLRILFLEEGLHLTFTGEEVPINSPFFLGYEVKNALIEWHKPTT
jgi:cytochrome P450